MNFMLKHLFKFLLFIALSILLFEVFVTNCRHSKDQDYSDIKEALISHLNITNEVLQDSIQNVVEKNWTRF